MLIVSRITAHFQPIGVFMDIITSLEAIAVSQFLLVILAILALLIIFFKE